MNNLKAYLSIILLLTISTIIGGCEINNEPDEPNETLPIHFMEWNSYYGFSTDDTEGFIQLPYLEVSENPEFIKNIRNVELISMDNSIRASTIHTILGTNEEEDDYIISTLQLTFNFQEYIRREFTEIRIETSEGFYTWDIGSIVIDFIESTDTEHIEMGAREIQSNLFSDYQIILKNVSEYEISIYGIEYELPKLNDSYYMIASDKFINNVDAYPKRERLTLDPGQEIYIRFVFDTDENADNLFICLKPYVIYEINEQRVLEELDYMIFSPIVTDSIAEKTKTNIPQYVEISLNK